jgi:hypothetical protein
MLWGEDKVYGKKYSSAFMATTPRSKLLFRTFELLENFVLKGTLFNPYGLPIVAKDNDTEVNYIENALDTLVNFIIFEAKHNGGKEEELCARYGLQDTKVVASVELKGIS